MPFQFDNAFIRYTIRELLRYEGNHREGVVDEVNRRFINYIMTFSELAGESAKEGEARHLEDWYIDVLLKTARNKEDAGVYGGVSSSTVTNLFKKPTRENTDKAALANIRSLDVAFDDWTAENQHHGKGTIVMRLANGMELDARDTLLVLNSLAVKRGQLNGGAWSAIGKATEEPLMQTLLHLFKVDPAHFRRGVRKDGRRQSDYMLTRGGSEYRCEVKLNGWSNPELATDAVARNPRLLVADSISEEGRELLNSHQIEWVCLSDRDGYQGLRKALKAFGFKHRTPQNLDDLEQILNVVLPLSE